MWEKAHIAVLASRREGLPKSLLEAAACGRPMIATDTPGCREIAIRDETALTFPVDDAAALAEALTRMAGDAEMRARFGKSARALVEAKFSAEAIGKETVALYQSLVPSALAAFSIPPPRGEVGRAISSVGASRGFRTLTPPARPKCRPRRHQGEGWEQAWPYETEKLAAPLGARIMAAMPSYVLTRGSQPMARSFPASMTKFPDSRSHSASLPKVAISRFTAPAGTRNK